MYLGRILLLIVAGAALLAGQSGETEFLKPDGISPANGYSHVVVTHPGKLIFIAGQVANNKQGQLVGKGDLKAQTEQAFENLKTALAAAGATFDHVVKINWYIRNYKPEDRAIIRAVRDRYVNTARPPASTLVGVAALFMDDYLIEVEATAVVPDKPR